MQFYLLHYLATLAKTVAPGQTLDTKNHDWSTKTVFLKPSNRAYLNFQHISSRRHKDRAAGKPAKPKYSPYTKTPKGQTKQQTGKTVRLQQTLCMHC